MDNVISNIIYKDFDAITGLSLEDTIKNLSFDVHKETLVAESAQVKVRKAVMLRTDDNARIGLVNLDRPAQNHGDTMRWLVDNFDKTGVPFKLKNSALSEKDLSLYQEYVFDFNVTPPDGLLLRPMVIARSSFVGKPLSLDFGTYRFTCANGVTVGRTLDKLSLSAKEFTNFARMSLSEAIRRNLDAYQGIETLYKKMADTSLQDTYEVIFGENKIPLKAKKSMLQKLESAGVLTIQIPEDTSDAESMVTRLRKPHFENIKDHVLFHSDTNLWEVYNHGTSWATRDTKSEATRIVAWNAIDSAFNFALAKVSA